MDLTVEQIMDEWHSLAKEAYENKIQMKPGALEYLMQESSKGNTLTLVSACVPELGHAVLNRHGLTELFDRIIFAQEVGLEKRDPDFFPQVLQLLNVAPEECIFYDDSPENCAAGKAVGMTVIGVLDPLYENDFMRMSATCDRYITNFTELLD